MAKEKEKKKIGAANKPTYTPIDTSLNKTYIQPRGALKSNIVVSEQDLMPTQRQVSQPIQVRGALAPTKPATPTKPVGTISEPIGLPSMETQLRTATSAFKPVIPTSLPSMQQQLETATTAFTPQSVTKELLPIQ